MVVLVTGGEGYVGSHCVIALLKEGYDVVIFDNESTGFQKIGIILKSISSIGKVIDVVKGDLLNISDLDYLFSHYTIDSVIHLAAFSQVSESEQNPSKYYQNNVIGTLNLLNTMVKHNVLKIVFSSTAAIYGEPEYLPIDENHPLNPINYYGRTKLDIEHLLDNYDRTYGLKSVRLRYFNVVGSDSLCRIGECHNPETHLVPNILKSLIDNSKVFHLYGTDYNTRDGTCIRDYVNVEDLSDAHIFALKYLVDGGQTDYFNIGSNRGFTVREVFELCERIVGKTASLCTDMKRVGDPAILIADSTKALNILGWYPTHDLCYSIYTAYQWELKIKSLEL